MKIFCFFAFFSTFLAILPKKGCYTQVIFIETFGIDSRHLDEHFGILNFFVASSLMFGEF